MAARPRLSRRPPVVALCSSSSCAPASLAALSLSRQSALPRPPALQTPHSPRAPVASALVAWDRPATPERCTCVVQVVAVAAYVSIAVVIPICVSWR